MTRTRWVTLLAAGGWALGLAAGAYAQGDGPPPRLPPAASQPAGRGPGDGPPPATQPGEWRRPHRGGQGEGPGGRPMEKLRELALDGSAAGTLGPLMMSRQNFALTPEQEAKVLEWTSRNFPEQYTAYMEFKRINPEMAEQGKNRWLFRAAAVMQLANEDPALANTVIQDIKLQEQIGRVLRNLQGAGSEPEKTAADQELTALLTEQAQVRLENRRIKLGNLQKRLDNELTRLEADRTRIAELVASRKAELLRTGGSSPPGGGPPDGPPGPHGGPRGGRPPGPPPPGEN